MNTVRAPSPLLKNHPVKFFMPNQKMFRTSAILCLILSSFAVSAMAQSKSKKQAKSNQTNTDDMWVTHPVPELFDGVTHHTYRNRSMARDIGYCIYLPPSYEKDTTRRYPVIYHLHGAGGNEFRSIYSASVLHEGILTGRWPEMIVVFPNGGRSTMYQDSGDGRFLAETNIINELIPHIDKTYRTIANRNGRCIEGFSMGGRGSTHLAMKFPQMFCSLFNQSGNVYHVSDTSQLPNAYLGDDIEHLQANDPYLNLKKNLTFIREHLRIQVACGTNDPDHLITVREYHAALTEHGVQHEYFEVEGLNHNQKTMINGRKDNWFNFHVESLKLNGTALHYLSR